MDMPSALLALCEENSSVASGFPHTGQAMWHWNYFWTVEYLVIVDAMALMWLHHYNDVIMDEMASQITSLTIVYSTVYSGPDQRKHQSSALLAFVRWSHRWTVNSPHKWPITRKFFHLMTSSCYNRISWSLRNHFPTIHHFQYSSMLDSSYINLKNINMKQ